jgi:hypothetical protein
VEEGEELEGMAGGGEALLPLPVDHLLEGQVSRPPKHTPQRVPRRQMQRISNQRRRAITHRGGLELVGLEQLGENLGVELEEGLLEVE